MNLGSPITRVRVLLLLVVAVLLVSGLTAIPLETELTFLTRLTGAEARLDSAWAWWLVRVQDGLVETNARHPFLAYGTDWLAFSQFVIAIAFLGPLRDPVRNVWVVEFGIIACLLVIPFAWIVGGLRDIPTGGRLIDSSFGLIGFVVLWICRREIRKLAVQPGARGR